LKEKSCTFMISATMATERDTDRNWKPQRRGGDNNRNNGYDGGDTR